MVLHTYKRLIVNFNKQLRTESSQGGYWLLVTSYSLLPLQQSLSLSFDYLRCTEASYVSAESTTALTGKWLDRIIIVIKINTIIPS